MRGTEIKPNILRYMDENQRFDGRKLDQLRPIEIEYDVIKTAEGSARVKMGGTEVIAGIKLEIGSPFPDTPDNGALMVGVELLPLASPEFEKGPPSIDSIEMSRVVDRGIRESEAIDTKKLCITKGEKVWMVMVDICPINDDGNMLDVSGLAAIAALKVTKFPEFDGESIDYKKPRKKQLPISKVPIPITVYKVADKLFVDPVAEEQKEYDGRLTVTSTEKGMLCAMQKGGDEPLSADDVDDMVKIAVKKADEIRKKL
ncbi:exosome complex protein Rrp42 [Candidatus Woesearchaeota archaeon]|nr:exosome complex protein Rrp42 [Candidatus Woesearchaeota archaeon]